MVSEGNTPSEHWRGNIIMLIYSYLKTEYNSVLIKSVSNYGANDKWCVST